VVGDAAPEETGQRDLSSREAKPARHAQEIGHRDACARIVRVLPLGHRCRLIQTKSPFLDEKPHQGGGHALAHRPALELGVGSDAGRVTLGHEPAAVHDDERSGVVGRIRKSSLDGGFEPVRINTYCALVWQALTHGPVHRLGRWEAAHDGDG
jgi:hypothetical protein